MAGEPNGTVIGGMACPIGLGVVGLEIKAATRRCGLPPVDAPLPPSSDVVVKTVRIWLLVVLAVLLPLRGAVAAAMMCPPAAGQAAASAAVGHEHHHGMAASVDHHHGHDAGTAEKCNLCCEFCSMTTMSGSPLALPLPQDFSTVSFPDLLAPDPSFISSGPERPPRSI